MMIAYVDQMEEVERSWGGGVGGRVNEPDGIPLSLLGSHNLALSWVQDLPARGPTSLKEGPRQMVLLRTTQQAKTVLVGQRKKWNL